MTSKITLFIILLLITAPAASASAFEITDIFKNIKNDLKKLTFTSYASSVPVQIGYDKPSNFWIVSGTIGWQKDQMVLVKLPANEKDDIGSNEFAKAQNTITITFDPKGSYETAPLTKQPLYFTSNYITGSKSVTYYYQVEGASWKTTTVYDVSVNSDTKTVTVGMDAPADVPLGQGVFVKNLGILPNGANAPSGDYIMLLNPENNRYEFYSKSDVQTAINYWASNIPFRVFGEYTWADVWAFLKQKNWLPPKPVTTATSYDLLQTTTGDYGFIKMTYPKVAYSSSIAVYIPSSLANTVILKMGASKAKITGTTSFKTTEGQQASFTVTVRNDGGDDYVTVKAQSSYYTIQPVTQFMAAGETKVFTLTAYALEITGDQSSLPISVTADGSDPYNGDDTTTIYATTYDSGAGNTNAKLTVKPLSPTGTVLSNAEISIDNTFVFKGQNYVTKPKGEYTISSKNVDGFYTPVPARVTMNGVDQTVTLQFTTAPQGEDLTWIFWGIIGLIIVFIVFKTGPGAQIIKNPVLMLVVIVLLITAWFAYQALKIALGIYDSSMDAYNNAVAWLPWNW